MTTVTPLPDRNGLVATIAENVRVAAARRGWNQSDLARALGVTSATVSRKWFGARQWQLTELEDVAKVLGVDVQDLLRARRDSNPQPADP
ncbi:helix-turn-helix domain-containing protein [Propioniciclava sp.]|uniref:helix-turn-helix domain-containing protein n=1 Tax=Propioniciclava sp. TaxID=2038686 RepID=UPI0039E31C2B